MENGFGIKLLKGLLVGLLVFCFVSWLTGGIFPFFEIIAGGGAAYLVARR